MDVEGIKSGKLIVEGSGEHSIRITDCFFFLFSALNDEVVEEEEEEEEFEVSVGLLGLFLAFMVIKTRVVAG